MQIKVSDAKTAYDIAVTRLNNLLGHANQIEVTLAESNVNLAEAALAEAQRELEKVKDGPDPDALALTQARLAIAESRLASAKAGPSAEQLSLAQAQVDNARRALETLDVQLKKMVTSGANRRRGAFQLCRARRVYYTWRHPTGPRARG